MPEEKTYSGGCHCGRVQFQATMALGPVISCNCSICSKRGSLLSAVSPDAFTYTKGSDADLTVYQFNKHVINHMFCPTCGILPFAKGTGRDGKPMMMINVRSLDGVDFDTLEIMKYDGRSR
jgi:hypothetical protein